MGHREALELKVFLFRFKIMEGKKMSGNLNDALHPSI
jgi:hypothetical protein